MKVTRTINGKEIDVTRGVLRECYTSLNLLRVMDRCKYCSSEEVTYNQQVMDSYCSDCGTWQERI